MADEPFAPYVGPLCRTTLQECHFCQHLAALQGPVMSTLEGLIQDYSLPILLNIFYRYNLTRANKNIQESFKELKVKQSVNISDHLSVRRVHRHVIK